MFGYSLIKTSRLKDLQSAYDNFVGYYVANSFNKNKTDKVLIKESLEFLERVHNVKSNKIEDILIDRKQNKMVALIK